MTKSTEFTRRRKAEREWRVNNKKRIKGLLSSQAEESAKPLGGR